MPDPFRCAACGQPIDDDQTAVRLSVGVGDAGTFSHLLMRPDIYLHAGRGAAGPWDVEASNERWCATPGALERALNEAARVPGTHATTGASGTYHGD